jgi:hypothetical protein
MSSEDEKESDRLQEMLEKDVARIGEHFDSVIIIATKNYNGEDFVRHKAACGSVYANYGAAREWVLSYEARVSANAQRKDDDDE